jgi:regulatory protein
VIQHARPQLSLKGRALRLLSQREHSRSELERKLARHAESPGDIARVLDELESRGFIDHERVAVSVVHRRAAKLGTLRIKQELQSKGLESELVNAAVAGLRASELDRAREVWGKKFGAPPQDANERAKQARFLAARGFDGDVIRRVLSQGSGDASG